MCSALSVPLLQPVTEVAEQLLQTYLADDYKERIAEYEEEIDTLRGWVWSFENCQDILYSGRLVLSSRCYTRRLIHCPRCGKFKFALALVGFLQLNLRRDRWHWIFSRIVHVPLKASLTHLIPGNRKVIIWPRFLLSSLLSLLISFCDGHEIFEWCSRSSVVLPNLSAGLIARRHHFPSLVALCPCQASPTGSVCMSQGTNWWCADAWTTEQNSSECVCPTPGRRALLCK